MSGEDNVYQCPICGTVVDIPEDESSNVYSYFTDTIIRDVCADLERKTGYTGDSLHEHDQNRRLPHLRHH